MIDLTKKIGDMKKEIGFLSEKSEIVKGNDVSIDYLKNVSDFLTNNNKNDLLHSCVEHAFSNAIKHGNKSNMELPLEVIIYSGEKGSALQIKDSGEGFNYLRQYIQTKNKDHDGKGTLLFDLNFSNIVISYENPGNVLDLMYKFPEKK